MTPCSHRTYQGAGIKREYLTIDEIKVLIDTECPAKRETCLPFRLLLRFEVERCLCLTMERYCSGRGTIPDVNRDAKNYHTDFCLFPAMPSVGCLKGTVRRRRAACLCRTPAEPNINKVLAKWMATAGINKKKSPITRAAHVRHNDAYPSVRIFIPRANCSAMPT